MGDNFPNLLETSIAAMLHDIGKLLQRAHGSSSKLSPAVRDRESDLLPSFQGRYTHKHALWSEEFFFWMESSGLSFPPGVNRSRVRDAAVFHHKPEAVEKEIGAVGWIVAEADRLSAGMERKEKDEREETEADTRGRDAFIKTPLQSPFAAVDLGLAPSAAAQQQNWQCQYVPLQELAPNSLPMPSPSPDVNHYPQLYAKLWQGFQQGFRSIQEIQSADLFTEALLALSERYLHAVPSSTKDQPDISLHDHSRVTAALAAALYQWHQRDGSLHDPAKVRDKSVPKFCFLAGDLSGIQHTLFLLASQQVRGVNRILRARSFLLSMLVEAAALACRRRLNLPPFNVLQLAGGRFLLLAAALDDLPAKVENLRRTLDPWLLRRYRGELALNLALTTPFSGERLLRDQLPDLLAELSAAVEDSKLRSFAGSYQPLLSSDYTHGVCQACGLRPASPPNPDQPESHNALRCDACEEERRLGGDLPRVVYLAWREAAPSGQGRYLPFFDNLFLEWHFQRPRGSDWLSLQRVYSPGDTIPPGDCIRWLANYVPRLTGSQPDNPAYRLLSEEARQTESGDLKTFEHLALDALRIQDNQLMGQALLGVLKADVDRLGLLFAAGLPEPTLSRVAALSRTLDLFFAGFLPQLLHSRFPDTYTVYAGGDDLLLLGPWNRIVELAQELRHHFRQWVGGNPNITLSAGIELVKPAYPLNRAVWMADDRLERSKDAGRDRICLLSDQPLSWEQFRLQLALAHQISQLVANREISHRFLYRMLLFNKLRLRAEGHAPSPTGAVFDLDAAGWRARWGYQLSRQLNAKSDQSLPVARQQEIARLLRHVLGLQADLTRTQTAAPDATMALSIALYENRNPLN